MGLGCGFWVVSDDVRRASALARSAIKVVAAASVMVGGRRAGRCCCRALDGRGWRSKRHPRGAGLALSLWCWAWASDEAWLLVWAMVWRRFWVAVSWWSWVVARFRVSAWRQVGVLPRLRRAGLAGVCCRPNLPVAGFEAAAVFTMAEAPAVGTGFGARADGLARAG